MIQKFLSLFSKKRVVENSTKKSAGTAKSSESLKKELTKIKNHSLGMQEELAKIKEHLSEISVYRETIDSLHKKHDSHEKTMSSYAEKLSYFESKLYDHRIEVIELKSKINELNHVLVKVESIAKKVEELESAMQSKAEPPKVSARIARASAPTGSLLEQYHSLAPSTKKILGRLLQMHAEQKGKWVALSDLRAAIYSREISNSTLAAMAKAIRPLYENGFVEKRRDKSFVYVTVTKRGREAAKEAGLSQQAEKFDELFAKLDD